MRHESDLSLTYIRQHPGPAAAVVATQSAEEAAAFLETIPARDADELLARMRPPAAAAIVRLLAPESSSDILRKMDFVYAASILRQVPGDERAALLETLPKARRRAFESSLAFAEDTAGAHMTTIVETLSMADTVADALDRQRGADRHASDFVCVIDDAEKMVAGAGVLHGRPSVVRLIVGGSDERRPGRDLGARAMG